LKKNFYISCFKIIIIIVPFLWIFSRIDYSQLGDAVQDTSWWTMPVLLSLGLTGIILQGIRWWIALQPFVKDIPLKKVLSIHLKANFYSVVLPSSAAQDVVRSVLLARDEDYRFAFGASWICRLLGLLVLVSFSCIGFFLIGPETFPPWTLPSIAGTVLVLIGLITFSFSKKVTRPLRKTFSKILPKKISEGLEGIREGIYLFRNHKRVLFQLLIITIITQSVLIGASIMLIGGIANIYPVFECLAFVSIIEIVCISIPLTPNGMGVREFFMTLFFDYLLLSSEQLGIYVAVGISLVLLKLVGGVPILYELLRSNKKSDAS